MPLSDLLRLCHNRLQAERYRVVAERAGSPAPGRLVQLTPRPMAGIAAGWAALERAAGRDSAVYLTPISDERHHLVLSGLRIEEVEQLQATGFAPALVLDRRDGRHEVVLTAQNRNRPYEQAALAEASDHIRFSLGLGRSRFGLRIGDPDPPEAAESDSGDPRQRIYAQVLTATGAICERLGRLISRCIAVFERRFGRGPGSRLGRGLDPDGVQPHADAPLYWAHRADLLARWQGRWPDPSRVDVLIARRLRATEHDEAAVATLITACAPGVPRIGRHGWQGYGRRAAAHAFRTDTDDSEWVFDRTSSAMWAALEQAVTARAKAQTMSFVTIPQPLLPPLPEPALHLHEDKPKPGTTRRTGRRERGDPGGPGDR